VEVSWGAAAQSDRLLVGVAQLVVVVGLDEFGLGADH
jgi:hypothetical protein